MRNGHLCEISLDDAVELDASFDRTAVNALGQFAEMVMNALELDEPLTLSLHITTDEKMHELNQKYRGLDAPTDILSFAADPLPAFMLGDETPHLGDLVMAYSYTLCQAKSMGHAPDDEFRLLIIHGILHLIGYTHDEDAAQKRMWAKQAELLAHFDIPIVVPAYVHGSTEDVVEDDASCGN
jgi:probable rRNA maturation factor